MKLISMTAKIAVPPAPTYRMPPALPIQTEAKAKAEAEALSRSTITDTAQKAAQTGCFEHQAPRISS